MTLPELQHMTGLAQEQARIERQLAARGIKSIRTLERLSAEFVAPSSLSSYKRKARRLESFLSAVKQSSSQEILDIGAGTMQATAELARSHVGSDFIFSATVLKRLLRKRKGIAHAYRTPAETLKGVPENAFGGIIALQSIAFSKSPAMVAVQLQKHMVPGGILLATFRKHTPYSPEWEYLYNEWGYATHDKLSSILRDTLHWDVAVLPGKPGEDAEDDVLIAVKPGGKVKARDILR